MWQWSEHNYLEKELNLSSIVICYLKKVHSLNSHQVGPGARGHEVGGPRGQRALPNQMNPVGFSGRQLVFQGGG
jgi:hypothetical protein